MEFNDRETVLMRFMDRLIADHQKAIGHDSTDVYILSLEHYKNHLIDLEKKDIGTLNK